MPQVEDVLAKGAQTLDRPSELVLLLLPDRVSAAVVDLKDIGLASDVGKVVTLRILQAPPQIEQTLVLYLGS